MRYEPDLSYTSLPIRECARILSQRSFGIDQGLLHQDYIYVYQVSHGVYVRDVARALPEELTELVTLSQGTFWGTNHTAVIIKPKEA